MRSTSMQGMAMRRAQVPKAPVTPLLNTSSRRTSVVSRFSIGSIGNAAIAFLAHPGRVVAEAIYQQPINAAVDSGLDLGAALGIFAGGVVGYMGYQLKQQMEMSSNTSSGMRFSQFRQFLENALKTSDQEVVALKAAISKAIADLEFKEAANTNQSSMLAELRGAVDNLTHEKTSLEAAIKASEIASKSLQASRDEAEANYIRARKELDAVNNKAAVLEEEQVCLRKNVASLQEQVESGKAAAAAVKADLEALTAKESMLNMQLASTNATVSELESKASDAFALALQLHQLKDEMEQMQSVKTAVEMELQGLLTTHSALQVAQEASIKQLDMEKAAAAAARAEMDTLAKKEFKMRTQLSNTRGKVAELEASIVLLETKASSADVQALQLQQLKVEMEQMSFAKNAVEMELQELLVAHSNLQAVSAQQMDVQKATARAEMDALANQERLMRTQLSDATAKVSELQASIALLEAKSAVVDAQAVELQQLKDEMQALGMAKTTVEVELQELRATYSSLQMTQEAENERLAKQEEALAQATIALEESLQYKHESMRLAEELGQYKQELAAAQLKAEADQELIARMNAELQLAHLQRSEMEQAFNAAQQAQVVPSLSLAAELELYRDTAKPVKALRAATRTRRSAAAPANEEESLMEGAAPEMPVKVAVARSASARSRVAKAKAGDSAESAGKAPLETEEPAAPVKKTRAARKPKAAAEGLTTPESVEVEEVAAKPAKATRKTKKSVAAAAEEQAESAVAAPRAELPWKVGKSKPNSA